MEAFVYCWTDHKMNKLYVGSHKGSEDDGYICSSKIMLEEYNQRPQDFTRQIVAEGLDKDIRKLEVKILESVNAKLNEDFYNLSNGYDNYNSQARLGRKVSEKTKEKMRKPKPEWVKIKYRGKRPHVNQTGSKNNNAVKIMTPFGKFDSIVEASKNLSIVYDNLLYKLRANHDGWYRIKEK